MLSSTYLGKNTATENVNIEVDVHCSPGNNASFTYMMEAIFPPSTGGVGRDEDDEDERIRDDGVIVYLIEDDQMLQPSALLESLGI